MQRFRFWLMRRFFWREVLLVIEKARKEGWDDGVNATEYVDDMLAELRRLERAS